MSPPLVVTVDGADLWGAELAPYLDGNQTVVVIVRAPAPPAPLVRLITPGTLVFQTSSDETAAQLLTTYAGGPIVGAIVPEGCAEFVHAPDAGRALHERTSVSVKPSGARRALPGWTIWQQEQELQQLLALAAPPVPTTSPAANGATAVAEPADRLAAWLLSHADPVETRG